MLQVFATGVDNTAVTKFTNYNTEFINFNFNVFARITFDHHSFNNHLFNKVTFCDTHLCPCEPWKHASCTLLAGTFLLCTPSVKHLILA